MISTNNNEKTIDSSNLNPPSGMPLVSTDHEITIADNEPEEIADKKMPAVDAPESMPHTSGENDWLDATSDDGNISSEELEITVETGKNDANEDEASTSRIDTSDDNTIPDLSDTWIDKTLTYVFSPMTAGIETVSNFIGYSQFIALLFLIYYRYQEENDDNSSENGIVNLLPFYTKIFIGLYALTLSAFVGFARYRQNIKAHQPIARSQELRSLLSMPPRIHNDSENQAVSIEINHSRFGKISVKLINGVFNFFVWQGEALELAAPPTALLQTIPEARGFSPTVDLLCQLAAFFTAAIPATATTASIHNVIKTWLTGKESNAPSWLERLEYPAATVKILMDFISNTLFVETLGHTLAKLFVEQPLSAWASGEIFAVAVTSALFAACPNGYAEKLMLNPGGKLLRRDFEWGNALAISGIFLQNLSSFSQNFLSLIILLELDPIYILPAIGIAALASVANTVTRAKEMDKERPPKTTLSEKRCGLFSCSSSENGYQAPVTISQNGDMLEYKFEP